MPTLVVGMAKTAPEEESFSPPGWPWTRSPLPVQGDPAHSPLLPLSLYVVAFCSVSPPVVFPGSQWSSQTDSWPLGHNAEPLRCPSHSSRDPPPSLPPTRWTPRCSSLSSSHALSSVQQQRLCSPFRHLSLFTLSSHLFISLAALNSTHHLFFSSCKQLSSEQPSQPVC